MGNPAAEVGVPGGDKHVDRTAIGCKRQEQPACPEAGQRLDICPLGKAIDVKNGILVRRQRDIERNRREVEVAETQLSRMMRCDF